MEELKVLRDFALATETTVLIAQKKQPTWLMRCVIEYGDDDRPHVAHIEQHPDVPRGVVHVTFNLKHWRVI